MKLFILDYMGTLTTLPDPVTFVQALKAQPPDSWVVLHTGTDQHLIETRHPGLVEALDDVWFKPCHLSEKMAPLKVESVVLVDDEEPQRRLCARSFRRFDPDKVQILDAGALKGLLQE